MNDARGPAFALVMAGSLMALVVLTVAVTWWRQPSAETVQSQFAPPPRPPRGISPDTLDRRAVEQRAFLTAQRERLARDGYVEELRRELAEARTQLDAYKERMRELRSASSEFDWDQALSSVGRSAQSLIAGDDAGVEPPRRAADGPLNGNTGGQAARGALAGAASAPADLDLLLERLAIGDFVDEQQRAEIEQLRQRLAVQTESGAATDEQMRELADRLEAQQLLQNVASRALIRLGAAAVPELTGALTDEDPLTREWAADVLGAMGRAARDALPALEAAEVDREPAVRTAVRRAIDAIREDDGSF